MVPGEVAAKCSRAAEIADYRAQRSKVTRPTRAQMEGVRAAAWP